MRVCLLGEQGERHDEGMKNMSMRLRRHLDGYVDNVRLVDLREVTSSGFWKELRSFDADVVHLIPGPTPQGLAFLSVLGGWKSAKTVATTTQPRGTDVFPKLPSALRPDMLMAQSASLRDQFDSAGYRTSFLPSGVDLEKFSTVPSETKRELREKLELPVDRRLFLHVGHFKEGRNVMDLTALQEFGEVIVIGSPSTGPEQTIVDQLRSKGCHVVTRYVDAIEEYYQASDVYAFPVRSESHSIQVPLSVFEAMACGCPVVATPFGGLGDCFDQGNGFRFVDRIDGVSESDLTFDDPEPREKVRAYSWDQIAKQTSQIYRQL